MTTADRARVEDLLAEIETLDEAVGGNDRYFRHRLRLMLEMRRALLSRPLRVQPEIGRD